MSCVEFGFDRSRGFGWGFEEQNTLLNNFSPFQPILNSNTSIVSARQAETQRNIKNFPHFIFWEQRVISIQITPFE
jgi:hypothetical protein